MQDMIDHHAMGVEMAQICLQNAVHEELQALCTDVINAQSAEIVQMQAWLQSWYGVTYSPTMKPGDERMLERLAALTGAEFEIEFMEMLIKHHERAIREAQSCTEKAFHQELISLCQNIVTAQAAEVQQLQAWLCQWYDRCRTT